MILLVPAAAALGLHYATSGGSSSAPPPSPEPAWESDPVGDPLGESRPVDPPEPARNPVFRDDNDNGWPDVVEDPAREVFNAGRDALRRGGDLVEHGLDQLPKAAGRFGSMSAGTLVLTTALTVGTVWLGWRAWKAVQ